MSTPSDEMLVQRQLRAAELALEAARRRRFEADDEVASLRSQVADLDAALEANVAARERDVAALRARTEAAEARQRDAEQRYQAERARRLMLEHDLAEAQRARQQRDELGRQLAAERRIRELEGELELVTRRAAEFEYGLRMAAFDAFKLVRDLTGKVTSLLSGAGLSEPEQERPAEGSAASQPDLDAQRLDAALERLRAAAPPSNEQE